jgi:hypothetical protein
MPARHHYVPEFYLRGWVTEPTNTLWRCVLSPVGKLHDKAVSPKATGFEQHLYTLSLDTPLGPVDDVSFIESSFFQKIDNDAAAVLPKLAEANLDLDDAERTAWSSFLLSLFERSPDRLNATETRAREVLDRCYDALQLDSEPADQLHFSQLMTDVRRQGFARNHVRHLMTERIRNPNAIARLKREYWCVVDNPNVGYEYITTDGPLVVDFGEREKDFVTLAIALNPGKLFVVHPPEWKGDADALDVLVSMATYHNALLVRCGCDYVYSHTQLQDNELIRHRLAAELYLRRSDAIS